MNGSKLPHSLRLVIFLLRLALGLNFIFNPLFGGTILGAGAADGRAMEGLSSWIGTSMSASAFGTFSAWAFLVIGFCLIVGLMTRLASIIGIALTIASYVPRTVFTVFSPADLGNDAVLIGICLLILIFSGAGEYLGLDRFIHVHFAGKHKK